MVSVLISTIMKSKEISLQIFSMLIKEVPLSSDSKYPDVACGTDELLCRMYEAYKMKGCGIDIDPQQNPLLCRYMFKEGLKT